MRINRIRGRTRSATNLVAAMDRVGLNKTYKVPGLVQPPRYVGLTQFEKRQDSKEASISPRSTGPGREHEAVLSHMSGGTRSSGCGR